MTLSIGEVENLPSGSMPYVVNNGTNQDIILNFGLPAGANGEPGPAGSNGINGVTPAITATASVSSEGNTGVSVTRTGTDAAPNFDFAFTGIGGGGAGGSSIIIENRTLQMNDTNFYIKGPFKSGDIIIVPLTYKHVATGSGEHEIYLTSTSVLQFAPRVLYQGDMGKNDYCSTTFYAKVESEVASYASLGFTINNTGQGMAGFNAYIRLYNDDGSDTFISSEVPIIIIRNS